MLMRRSMPGAHPASNCLARDFAHELAMRDNGESASDIGPPMGRVSHPNR